MYQYSELPFKANNHQMENLFNLYVAFVLINVWSYRFLSQVRKRKPISSVKSSKKFCNRKLSATLISFPVRVHGWCVSLIPAIVYLMGRVYLLWHPPISLTVFHHPAYHSLYPFVLRPWNKLWSSRGGFH